VSNEKADRGVDVELLAPEIEALRETAQRYTRAVDNDTGVGGAGLDLEAAAIRYVRKLDDELAKARRPDYAAIVERAMRDREKSGN
jgi:hypothetical protein